MNISVSRHLGIVVIQAQASGPSNHIPAVPILWERCQMGNRLRQRPQQPRALFRVALPINNYFHFAHPLWEPYMCSTGAVTRTGQVLQRLTKIGCFFTPGTFFHTQEHFQVTQMNIFLLSGTRLLLNLA